MVRLASVALCVMALAHPALAQGLPWETGTLQRGDEVRAGVQRRTEEGVRRERLRFGSPEDAQAWALAEGLVEDGLGGRVLVEVRGKRAVRLSGEGLREPVRARKALHEAWGEETAAEAPELLAVRLDRKVALLGAKVPADPGAKLPAGLVLDPEAARPLAEPLGDRKVELPAPPTPGLTGSVQPPS